MPYCPPCDRHFRLENSLHQHIGAVHPRTYCGRCERHFPHERAKEQHIENSTRHNICTHCYREPDFSSEDDLKNHLIRDHHACIPCDEYFSNDYDLLEHDVDVHDKCRTCGRFFKSRSNLINVGLPDYCPISLTSYLSFYSTARPTPRKLSNALDVQGCSSLIRPWCSILRRTLASRAPTKIPSEGGFGTTTRSMGAGIMTTTMTLTAKAAERILTC